MKRAELGRTREVVCCFWNWRARRTSEELGERRPSRERTAEARSSTVAPDWSFAAAAARGGSEYEAKEAKEDV